MAETTTQEPASKTQVKSFDTSKLSKNALENYNFITKRISELQQVRTNHYSKNLDQLWADADRDYVPHRLQTSGKKVIATDEDKGWRGALVTLGASDWQSDIANSNPYIKIQTALAILIDQNPTGVFTATTKQYEATNELIKQLYQRSWEFAKSRPQLKLFVFNLAKYGWACARTYPRKITRKVKAITEYNEDEPDKSKYEEKEVTVYNDIYRENLDVRNVWIDDQAEPNNSFSVNDWCWRKVYDIDEFKEEFKGYKGIEDVSPSGVLDEVINGQNLNKTKSSVKTGRQIEVYFYENLRKDIFCVLAGGKDGTPIILDPLPISDSQGNKKLSLWQTYWTLRHARSPYGIGIYEAIRYDNAFLDRVRNMTMDQLTLSIYKMFFYQGTQSLTETGDITISPGVGKQTLDPKNINFLQVPGPGQDAYTGIEMFQKSVDEVSGITDPLLGQVTGKTAFELAQAKESALKRMKEPLDNILEALNLEGYITVSLIQLLYSIPETYEISDKTLIEDYLQEVQSDPDLYERDEQGNFTAKVYREFPLNLEKDEENNLIETSQTKFFRVKPKLLMWEGIINIKSQSILTPSKQIDKALELEMYNVLIPLLAPAPSPTGQDTKPLTYSKIAKNVVKLYDKDPRDILPDSWLNPQAQQPQTQPQEEPLIVSANGGGPIPPDATNPTNQPEAQPESSAVPSASVSQQPKGFISSIMSKLSKPSRGV